MHGEYFVQNALWILSLSTVDRLFTQSFFFFFFLVWPLLNQITGHFIGEEWYQKIQNQIEKHGGNV
jgi:hypothetical protein